MTVEDMPNFSDIVLLSVRIEPSYSSRPVSSESCHPKITASKLSKWHRAITSVIFPFKALLNSESSAKGNLGFWCVIKERFFPVSLSIPTTTSPMQSWYHSENLSSTEREDMRYRNSPIHPATDPMSDFPSFNTAE